MHRILIIEDEEDIREILSDVLSLNSYEVSNAENGRIGIKKAFEEKPDLIICDIMMPEVNGYEVLKSVRSNPSTFSIPFLFLTAKSDKTDIRHGMDLGADDYITKPFEGDEILTAVKTRLEKSTEIKKHHEKKIEDLHLKITSSLPHELRTPLTVILGSAQILKKSSSKLSSGDIQAMSSIIYEAGNRLLKLITNYAHYTELLSLSLAKTQIDHKATKYPEPIISDTANKIAYIYRRDNDLEMDLSDKTLSLPTSHLIKLIEELVDNAFKFSHPGTKVSINTGVESGEYFISISNTGRGITKEQIENIGAFMQFDRNQYEQQGTGLGLAIAQKTTEVYNGEFNIISDPDRTTIIVSFPNHN